MKFGDPVFSVSIPALLITATPPPSRSFCALLLPRSFLPLLRIRCQVPTIMVATKNDKEEDSQAWPSQGKVSHDGDGIEVSAMLWEEGARHLNYVFTPWASASPKVCSPGGMSHRSEPGPPGGIEAGKAQQCSSCGMFVCQLANKGCGKQTKAGVVPGERLYECGHSFGANTGHRLAQGSPCAAQEWCIPTYGLDGALCAWTPPPHAHSDPLTHAGQVSAALSPLLTSAAGGPLSPSRQPVHLLHGMAAGLVSWLGCTE